MANYLLPKKICSSSCSILQTHKDVVTEIALHLPLPSLFRCRAVCKLWRDVIDSPFFRKLHTHTRSNNKEKEDDDETVYLQFNHYIFEFGSNLADVKVSITKLLDNGNGKSLVLNLKFDEGYSQWSTEPGSFSMALKGLICFNLSIKLFKQPIVICNPFLGQIRILPFFPILSSSCEIIFRDVAIGCDGEFYKVVELVYCLEHRCSHARLYSRRKDSWREIGGGSVLDKVTMFTCGYITILSCNDGHFAHWYAWTSVIWVILTFDMKNEVFRATKLPYGCSLSKSTGIKPDDVFGIVAKDNGDSFILIILPHRSDEFARIYESSISICEEENGITRKLSWKHVVNLEHPLVHTMPAPLPLRMRDCVIVKMLFRTRDIIIAGYYAYSEIKHLFYDYCARRFIGCFNLPASSELLCYEGTFVSP